METSDPDPENLVLHDAIGTAVRSFRRARRGRRSHPVTVHLGVPGGARAVVPSRSTDRTDQALRVDLLIRLLGELPPGRNVGWITRGGILAPGDEDFAWFTAARAAFGAHHEALPAFFVVTRSGWLDLVNEEVRATSR